jgi:hypothetical protein
MADQEIWSVIFFWERVLGGVLQGRPGVKSLSPEAGIGRRTNCRWLQATGCGCLRPAGCAADLRLQQTTLPR